MATIKLRINGTEDVTVMVADDEFLQTIHNDSSILLNVAQQFVQYNVETVEILGLDAPINSNISDEVTQPSPQLKEDPKEEREDKKVWNDENIGLLIQFYQKYGNEFNSGIKKHIWSKIAKDLCEVVGVYVTANQCDTKWKGLLRQYKVVKKHNETSGNDHKYWKFYSLMNAILHKKPEIEPVAVCSSSRGLQENESSEGSRSSTPTLNTPTRSRKRINENAIERRHKERMQRQDRFLNILDIIAKNMTQNNDKNSEQDSLD